MRQVHTLRQTHPIVTVADGLVPPKSLDGGYLQVRWFALLILLSACTQNPVLTADSENTFEQAAALAKQCVKFAELPSLFERRHPDLNIVKVTVEYLMLPNHRVSGVRVISSTGYEELDSTAIQSVKNWSCNNSMPMRVPVRVQQTFVYRLNGTPLGLNEDPDWPSAKISFQWVGPYDASAAVRLAILSNEVTKANPERFEVVPLNDTTQIRAKLGTNFGISYIFDAPTPRTFVNHRVVWKFPEGGYVHGYSGKRVHRQLRDKACRVGYQCIAGWTFDQEWELVPGIWTVEVWHNDELALSHSFEVVR